ncbi:Hypothetical protein SRAE_1000173350 [Strongyloides ratti]|uniref:Uncharacterized protein n=1 Tax=Strongyloides ratti TaxID=34506 RepID=A0A090L5S8_STRRB|nr:Hypothetical protein SRAE_1000173350 [Strongyloides ratti]CEF63472.1 Hypothetical protein SRAE_1000173350 [Strongyloides ratti]
MKFTLFLIIIFANLIIPDRTKFFGKYVLYPKQQEMLKFDGENQNIQIDWNKFAIIVKLTVENWLKDAQVEYNRPINEKIIEGLKIIEKNGD